MVTGRSLPSLSGLALNAVMKRRRRPNWKAAEDVSKIGCRRTLPVEVRKTSFHSWERVRRIKISRRMLERRRG